MHKRQDLDVWGYTGVSLFGWTPQYTQGFAFGRRQARRPEMDFINHANVIVFCPALVFSALVDNPVDLGHMLYRTLIRGVFST